MIAYPDFKNSLVDNSSHKSSSERPNPKDPVLMKCSADHSRPKASGRVYTATKKALLSRQQASVSLLDKRSAAIQQEQHGMFTAVSAVTVQLCTHGLSASEQAHLEKLM